MRRRAADDGSTVVGFVADCDDFRRHCSHVRFGWVYVIGVIEQRLIADVQEHVRQELCRSVFVENDLSVSLSFHVEKALGFTNLSLIQVSRWRAEALLDSKSLLQLPA